MKKFSSLIVCVLTCFLTLIIATGCDACGGDTNVITLDAGAGAQIEKTSVEVSAGQEYRLPSPTKVGYNFLGWKNGDEKFNSIGIWSLEDDVTLTANWESKVYNVTLNTNGGELLNATFKVAYGAQYTLPTPTKEGNDFVGWKYNGEFIEDGTWDIDVDAVVFEAVWNPSVTKITFDLNGGNFINSTATTVNVTYGSEFTFPTAENGAHKILVGWKNLQNGNIYKVDAEDKTWKVQDKEITLTAVWINDNHVLNLELDGATKFDCELQEVLDCGTVYTLPTVAKKGYLFLGWYVDETKIETPTYIVDGDVTITAKWQKIVTTVIYSGEGISFENDTIEFGTSYVLEILDASTYAGWRAVDTKQYVKYTGTWEIEATEVTLEPILLEDACIVTFTGEYINDNGINVIDQKIYTEGEIVTAPIPEVYKPGYEFTGWAEKGSTIPINFNNAWNFVGTKELVAQWKIKNFTITFDANGGEFTDGKTLLEGEVTIKFGSEFDFTAYTPSYAGYEFKGWEYDDYFLGPVNPEDLFEKGEFILEKGEWSFDGQTTITLKAIWISLEDGFGPNV